MSSGVDRACRRHTEGAGWNEGGTQAGRDRNWRWHKGRGRDGVSGERGEGGRKALPLRAPTIYLVVVVAAKHSVQIKEKIIKNAPLSFYIFDL